MQEQNYANESVDQAGEEVKSTYSSAEQGKRKGSKYGCLAIGFIIIGVMAVFSFILFFGFLAAAIITGAGEVAKITRVDAPRFQEETVMSIPGVEVKTAIIEVGGLISYGSRHHPGDANLLGGQVRQAMLDPQVVAVVLDVNSPGGEITAVDEVHYLVRELSRNGKPVVAVMRSMGASGAYYIAAASNHIIANPMTITGSIGVIIPHFEYSELLRKIGVSYTPYKSGELKDLLSGGVDREPEKQDKIDAHLQSLVDHSFERFAEGIVWGRDRYNNVQQIVESEFGDGRILSGSQAYELGLVDELGHFEDGLKKARELAEVPETNIVRYRRPWRFRDMLLMGKGDTNLLKINANSLLDSGQGLYYILPGILCK